MLLSPGPSEAAAALRWIVGVLRGRGIPFQVSGGLAARSHGAARPLADIDLDVPEGRMAELLPDVAPYVRFGPARHRSERWDLELLTLEYGGQEIDLGGAETTRVRDLRTGLWHPIPADLARAEERVVLGLAVPVIPRADLLAYKALLDREVDRLDIAALSDPGAAPPRT